MNETRKVADKFLMNDPRYLDFLRSAFLKMRRNQKAYIKIGEVQHRRIYHKNNLQMQKTQEEKDHMTNTVGPDIYVRCEITSIKRDPKCDMQAPLDQKLVFFEKVRKIGKDLVQEEEYSNAKTLYSRCISIFKNMPKKQKDSLDDEQNK